MKKIALVLTAVALVISLTACTGKDKPQTETGGAANGNSPIAPIGGEGTDQNLDSDAGGPGMNYVGSNDFDNGFPSHMPLYEGFEIEDMDTYGDDGYTVIYNVDTSYENVVGFYMMNIPGLDESGIGDDESYFENVDFDGIHLNGLTITNNGDYSTVYITLKYADGDYQEDDGDGDSYGYDDDENETEADYDSIIGMTPHDDYPSDVVPLYDTLKLTTVSSPPSGDLYVYEGVAAPGSFDDAVYYYAGLFGEPSKSFDSPAMKTTEFEGEKSDWSYSVIVGDIYTSGNCIIQITLQK